MGKGGGDVRDGGHQYQTVDRAQKIEKETLLHQKKLNLGHHAKREVRAV